VPTSKTHIGCFVGGVVREDVEKRWQENRLLAALPERDRSRLIPQLEILTLFAKEAVHESGEELNFVYFPLDCIVALVSSVESKATVEVGLIGNEGLVGAPILMGAKHANSQAHARSDAHLCKRVTRAECATRSLSSLSHTASTTCTPPVDDQRSDEHH
jgi:hypothetical protein